MYWKTCIKIVAIRRQTKYYQREDVTKESVSGSKSVAHGWKNLIFGAHSYLYFILYHLDPPPIFFCELLFFQTPPPTALEIPMPIPTAAPMTTRAMRSLTQIFCVWVSPLNGLHPLLLFIIRALFLSCCLPGHTSLSRVASEEGNVDDAASRSCSWALMWTLDSDLCCSREVRVVGWR